MPWADYERRPSWWPNWVPVRCGECRQPWLPGRVTLSWTHCSCPGAGKVQGHHLWVCATPGCHWAVPPPEHVPGDQDQERPRSYGSQT